MHELFDRVTVAMLRPARVEQLYAQLLTLVTREIGKLDSSSKGGAGALGRRALRTGIDVLSRIAFRLPEKELESLITKAAEWLVNNSVISHYELAEPLQMLLSRISEAVPSNMVTKLVELFLQLPIYGEPAYHPRAHEQTWPEPFEALWEHVRNVPPLAEKAKSWRETWQRMLRGIRSDDASLRRRAFIRGYFLDINGWLSSEERVELGQAVWEQTDSSSGLPAIRGFRHSVVLHLPQRAEHDAAALLKRSLLGRELKPWKAAAGGFNSGHVQAFHQWINDVAHVFRHSAIAPPKDIVLPLEPAEAIDLVSRLLEWWPTAVEVLSNPKSRDLPFGGFDLEPIARDFVKALSDSLLLHLPKKHMLTAIANQQLELLAARGYSIARAAPGRLFHSPENIESVTATIEAALLSADVIHVRAAAEAMTGWSRAARASLIPAMPLSLMDLLVARIALRQMAGLDSVIGCISRLIRTGDELTKKQEELLTRALDHLADDTSVERLRERFAAGEIDRVAVMEALHVRSWAGVLASALAELFSKRGEALPDVLERWRKICDHDPLPETRRAWKAET